MAKSKTTSRAMAAAEEAEKEAAEHRDTPAKERARMDELQERARLFGDSIKQSYNAKCLERKWLRFLLVHGEEIGFKAKDGPTMKQVQRFTTYCFCTRDVVSAIGREGMGDSYELQIRYMLAKFVFVSLGYKGWKELSAHALHEKAEPFKFAVKEQWARLKRSDPDLTSTLKPFIKTKWCDTAYFLSQVSAQSRSVARAARAARLRMLSARAAHGCAGSLHEASGERRPAPAGVCITDGGDGVRARDMLAWRVGLQGLV